MAQEVAHDAQPFHLMATGQLSKSKVRRLQRKHTLACLKDGVRAGRVMHDVIATLSGTQEHGEVVQRLLHIAPAIQAQADAAANGQLFHNAAPLLDKDVNVLCNAAKHLYTVPMKDITPAVARRSQRSKKSHGYVTLEANGMRIMNEVIGKQLLSNVSVGVDAVCRNVVVEPFLDLGTH